MGYVQPSSKGSTFRGRAKVGARLVSRSFPTRSEAWAWVERVESGLEAPDGESGGNPATSAAGAERRDAPLTLAQWLDDGGFVVDHLRVSTAATYSSLVKTVRKEFGDCALSSITRQQFQHWLLTGARKGERRGPDGKLRPRKAQSVKHIAKVAHAMFEQALDAGLIVVNPAHEMKVRRDDDPYEARFLTKAELTTLIAALDARYRGFGYLAGYGGLRASEVFGLRWRHLNLSTGRLEVKECATEVEGKIVLGPPKSKKGRRSFTLPKVAIQGMREHRERWRALGMDTSPDQFVVPNSDFGVMAQRNFRSNVWRKAIAAAEIGPVRPHELRHTAISLWIAAGMDPKEVSARAGHESVAFTLDRYGHLYPESDERGTAKFDDFLEEAGGAA